MAFFHYLTDAGLDPTVLFGYVTRHGYFPESVVTGSQFLVVQLAYLTESFSEGGCPARAVEVPDMDVGDFDCFQDSH